MLKVFEWNAADERTLNNTDFKLIDNFYLPRPSFTCLS